MFILYAVVIGLLLGLILGGRPGGLGAITFRWGWLAVAGFVTQIVLFSAPVTERIGALGVPIYVASTALVLAALLRNLSISGLWIVALGAFSNMAAIATNGGYMPADPGALASLGRSPETVYSNSSVVAHPALQPLTDIFAIPRGVPFANVFSVGDVLIGVGVVVAILVAMKRAPATPKSTSPDQSSAAS
ncbi:MAG TPA: DUF5317 domain-containing protein [Candidatus Limnocylindrales bacterium]|nr:DUF5317 domain-containing protein [Candidatus Limnocylindrales bacterium]